MLTNWTGDIPNGTVWVAGQVQRITGDVHIPAGATLTIEPGAVVKFNNSSGFTFTVDGTLLAQGTSGAPIVFTELRDDTGGDTNGDGGASSPSSGNWGQIEFLTGSTGSILDHVNIRYGGNGATQELLVAGGQLTLSNSSISNSINAGIGIQASNPVLTAVSLQNNRLAAISSDLSSQPVITAATVSGNGLNGLQLNGSTLPASVTWNNPSLVYALTGTITVPQGDTLTIGAGQIIKTPGSTDALIVNGTLLSNGTVAAPVIFTADRDDSRGGDTNGNGAANTAENGTWGNIQFNGTSTGSVLDHTNLFYGARFEVGEVVDNGGQLTISNSLLANAGGAGLRIIQGNPILTGNTFQNNSGAAISMDLSSQPVITGTIIHDDDKNLINGVQLDAGVLTASVAWNNPDVVYALKGTVTVPQGDTLTTGAGQIIKTPGGTDALIVNGTLLSNGTVAAPVIFTADRDDLHGGDTNGNGAANTAENGTWGNIQINGTSTGSVLDHTNVFFGSRSEVGEVVDNGGQLTISNSLLANAGGAGLRIIDGNPILTGNTFQNNSGAAINADFTSQPLIHGNTLTNNGTNGLLLSGNTLPASVTWNPDIVYILNGSSATVTIPAGVTLTLSPGQVVKSLYGQVEFIVNGNLKAEGTTAAPVVFTALTDDTVGGDTNNDGSHSTPGNGTGFNIAIMASSANSSLDHIEMRYGHDADDGTFGAINVTGTLLTVSNSVVRNSGHVGIASEAGSTLTLTNSLIVNNGGVGVQAESGSHLIAINDTIDGNLRGVLLDSPTATLTNDLITNNTSDGIFQTGPTNLTMSFTDVFNPNAANYTGLAPLTGTGGNVSVDPKYFNRQGGQYQLRPGSPAEDSGTSSGAPATDFFGNPRFKDPNLSGRGDGSGYDIGAIEVQQLATSNVDLSTTAV
ncbi:MAG: parallel beta-helix repeat protein, partial [Planctomycetaceae bacterium]|nr:parallel beta-helix repeat protein [Planctomycetaceae bacterium]